MTEAVDGVREPIEEAHLTLDSGCRRGALGREPEVSEPERDPAHPRQGHGASRHGLRPRLGAERSPQPHHGRGELATVQSEQQGDRRGQAKRGLLSVRRGRAAGDGLAQVLDVDRASIQRGDIALAERGLRGGGDIEAPLHVSLLDRMGFAACHQAHARQLADWRRHREARRRTVRLGREEADVDQCRQPGWDRPVRLERRAHALGGSRRPVADKRRRTVEKRPIRISQAGDQRRQRLPVPVRGEHERRSGGALEAQGVGQHRDRVRVRPLPDSALQHADRVQAEPSAPSEVVLRELRRQPMPAEELPEPRHRRPRCAHAEGSGVLCCDLQAHGDEYRSGGSVQDHTARGARLRAGVSSSRTAPSSPGAAAIATRWGWAASAAPRAASRPWPKATVASLRRSARATWESPVHCTARLPRREAAYRRESSPFRDPLNLPTQSRYR
jgi:hypothetical protein